MIFLFFEHKIKIQQIPQNLVYEKFTYAKKFYVQEIAVADLSKIYFLKNAKKTYKPNHRNLNRDWIICVFYSSIIIC